MSLLNIQYFGIQTPVIKPKENIIKILATCFDNLNTSQAFSLQENDIVVISSKIISMQQNLLVDLSSIVPSDRAKELGEKSNLDPSFCELVINEADQIIGVTYGALLTLNNGLVQANAGIDKSNAGDNKAILLPKNCDDLATAFKTLIETEFNTQNIGVLIIDSTTRPLRLGTTAMALGSAGFVSITDERGLRDLFGYKMKITYKNIADNVACASNLLMGESSEAIPFVIVRGLANITKDSVYNTKTKSEDLKISPDECMYFANFNYTQY